MSWSSGGRETVLFVDEVHRFSKAQQDALLPGVENRWVTLIAATTENPFFSVISPLLSRSLLLRLQSLTDADVRAVLDQAIVDERGLGGAIKVDEEAAGAPGPAGRWRRPPVADLPRGGRGGGGLARASTPSTSRPRRPPSTRPRCATTGRATSTTT